MPTPSTPPPAAEKPLIQLPGSLLSLTKKPAIDPNKVHTDAGAIVSYLDELFQHVKLEDKTVSDNFGALLEPKLFLQIEKQRTHKNEDQQIYNKLIFDAVNEACQELQQLKKPWIESRIKPDMKLKEYVKQKVMSWLGPPAPPFALDDVKKIIEKEEKQELIDFSKDELAIKTEVSEMIFADLIADAAKEIDALMKMKKQRKSR